MGRDSVSKFGFTPRNAESVSKFGDLDHKQRLMDSVWSDQSGQDAKRQQDDEAERRRADIEIAAATAIFEAKCRDDQARADAAYRLDQARADAAFRIDQARADAHARLDGVRAVTLTRGSYGQAPPRQARAASAGKAITADAHRANAIARSIAKAAPVVQNPAGSQTPGSGIGGGQGSGGNQSLFTKMWSRIR